MMGMGTQEQETSSGKTARMFSPLLVDGVAAASSLAAGGVMFWREVLSESYANFTSLDLVDDIKRKFRNEFGPAHADRVKNGLISAEQSFETILQQNEKYNAAVAERFEKAGFGNFGSRLKLLNSHEKWKISLTALAVTGVTLGSIMVIARGLFADQEKAKENQPIQR